MDLISEQLPFNSLWYSGDNAVENAIGYASHHSRAHETEVCVYDEAGALIDERRWQSRMQDAR